VRRPLPASFPYGYGAKLLPDLVRGHRTLLGRTAGLSEFQSGAGKMKVITKRRIVLGRFLLYRPAIVSNPRGEKQKISRAAFRAQQSAISPRQD
jgi:hypothetical protein